MLDTVRELTSVQPGEPAVLFREPPQPAGARRTASPDEPDARETGTTAAARTVGAPLLASATADELDDRLDELLESGEVRRAHAAVANAVAELRTRLGALADTQVSVAALRMRYGDRAAELVVDAMAANDHSASALQRRERAIVRGSVADSVPGMPEQIQDDGAIGWVWHLPAAVGEALLTKERGTACSMALFVAMVDAEAGSNVVDRWLIEALAQRWRDGEQAGLRFVASLPGTDVPEGVVSVDQRLNLQAELERHRRVETFMGELSAARQASGAVAYPPFDDDSR